MSVKLKKAQPNHKTRYVGARFTETEYNEAKIKANLYCDGNISQWVVFASVNYRVTMNDLIQEAPSRSRKK